MIWRSTSAWTNSRARMFRLCLVAAWFLKGNNTGRQADLEFISPGLERERERPATRPRNISGRISVWGRCEGSIPDYQIISWMFPWHGQPTNYQTQLQAWLPLKTTQHPEWKPRHHHCQSYFQQCRWYGIITCWCPIRGSYPLQTPTAHVLFN